MLDIKRIRENPEAVQRAANLKRIAVSIPDLLRCDETKRRLTQESEVLRRNRNELTGQVHALRQGGAAEEAEKISAKVRQIGEILKWTEAALQVAEQEFKQLMLRVPNIVSDDTPVGGSDLDNVEWKRVGEPPVFPYELRDHMALGELHDLFDIPRGVKTAGTRSYYLKGNGFHLHRAVQQLAVDLLIRRGFTMMDVPLIVRPEAMVNAGFFPLGQDQTYEITGEQKWLAGTSEVPLVSYYSGEIIDLANPIRLAAVSNCFRSEVGSAGRDVQGLYRVHQFAKVEQVVLCSADAGLSEMLLQEITANAEELLLLLELPYRVVVVCIGDMSQKTYKQYDIETWMPSRRAYGETHSSSNLLDFQARRSNIRYRKEDGTTAFCHTLNNTAVASPRILIPLLENHQREDGSIHIPHGLRPYMYGLEKLDPPL